jgi:Ca-activated chloride channel homolog
MSFHVRLPRYCFAWIPCFALALVALACASECSAAPESQDANIIFIFDASGSMGAKIQGHTKIDTAKEVLSTLIKDLPAQTKVGLVVYGHRQKGDCTDVEEVSPLGPVDKEVLLNRIKGINPKGMTPITYSLQKVAEGLKNRKDESTIILVSDGEETCKGDPCAAVAELRNSGIKFVIHVIGFDVNEKEKEQLSCIARAGGGSYFTARNAGELMVAAKKAVQKQEEPKPATLTVKASMNGKPFRAFCEIYGGEGDTAKAKGKAAEGWTDNGSKAFQLPPGLYDLKVESRDGANKQAVDFMAIPVEAGKNIDKLADFSGGTLKIKALRNGTPFRAYSAVLKQGADDERVTEGWTDAGAQGFKLPPGVYDVNVENHEDANRPTVNLQGIKIEAGKTVEKVAEFSGGSLKIKALMNDKPFRAFCLIYTAQEEENEKKKITEGWTDVEGIGFKLTPGAYDVVVENQDGAEKSTVNFTGVSIEAAKAVEKVADFSGGTLKIRASRNAKPLSADCKIYKADAGEAEEKQVVSEVWTGMEGALLKLKPGVYDAIVENREDANGLPVSFKGIAIEVGKTVEKTADFSGGTLKVKAQRNGKLFSAHCEVYTTDESGEKKVLTGDWTRDDAATFNLIPGTYDLIVINTEDAGEPKLPFPGITIEPGKTVEKTADFSGGTLRVKAQRNGKLFSANCEVYTTDESGEKKVLTGDWTRDDAATFKLLPGTYDLIVTNNEDAGSPKVSFPGITIEPGKTLEKTADFSGGTLRVKALRNGKLFSANCEVYTTEEGEKKVLTGDWTRDDAATFKLLPGIYDLTVTDSDDAGEPKVSFSGITIEPGKAVEKTAEFSGGTLKVKALRKGKLFSANCQVYTMEEGEKKLLTGDWSRDDAATFKLVPGVYFVVVEDGDSHEKKEFKDVNIEAGKAQNLEAAFQ